MSIDEIIHAWENSALPTSITVLMPLKETLNAHIMNAREWEDKAKTPQVMAFYSYQVGVCKLILREVEHLTRKAVEVRLAAMEFPEDEITNRRKITFEQKDGRLWPRIFMFGGMKGGEAI